MRGWNRCGETQRNCTERNGEISECEAKRKTREGNANPVVGDPRVLSVLILTFEQDSLLAILEVAIPKKISDILPGRVKIEWDCCV